MMLQPQSECRFGELSIALQQLHHHKLPTAAQLQTFMLCLLSNCWQQMAGCRVAAQRLQPTCVLKGGLALPQKPFAKDLTLLLEVFNLVFDGLDPGALLAARHAPQPAPQAPKPAAAAAGQVVKPLTARWFKRLRDAFGGFQPCEIQGSVAGMPV